MIWLYLLLSAASWYGLGWLGLLVATAEFRRDIPPVPWNCFVDKEGALIALGGPVTLLVAVMRYIGILPTTTKYECL